MSRSHTATDSGSTRKAYNWLWLRFVWRWHPTESGLFGSNMANSRHYRPSARLHGRSMSRSATKPLGRSAGHRLVMRLNVGQLR